MSTTPPEPAAPGSHYQPSIGVVLVILVAFVAGAFLMLRSTKPGHPVAGSPTTTVPTSSKSHGSTSTTVVEKSQVRVQVANGTTVTGLARSFTQQLLTYGWDTLPQANGPHVSSTIIYFNPGFASAARMIAAELKFPPSSVRPLNGGSPVAGAASDDVIVILGPNAAVAG